MLLKATALWMVILVIAILNGIVREVHLVPRLGAGAALPLSGGVLSVLIFVVTLASVRTLGIVSANRAWLVGALWLSLTVAFELLFGHYALGQSWERLLAAYDPANGNLWLLVLFTTLCGPFLAGKTRGAF